MTSPATDDIRGIDLSDDEYTVDQSLIRNECVAEDADGVGVLHGKRKLFKLKEQFPFTDGQGDDVFEVTAGGVIDVAGNYVLTDARTGEDVVAAAMVIDAIQKN